MSKRPFVPIVRNGEPVTCPFCDGALGEGRFHTCPELRNDPLPASPAWIDTAERAATAFAIGMAALLAVFSVAYLGGHVLVALGVPCPS